MADLPNYTTLARIARDEVLTQNPLITVDAIEREGMDANILVASAAAPADEVVGQITDLAAAQYLDSCPGLDQGSYLLDRLVFDRYGLLRKPAAASLGSVQFYCSTPAPATFALPTGVILTTASGTQFITTAATIFPSGSLGPITVSVSSVLAGPSLDAAVGTITGFVTPVPSSPQGFYVTNLLASTGCADVETDGSLRERARNFWTTAVQGTNSAIQNAALGVPGVTTASVIELIDTLGRPLRFVQLIVSTTFTDQFVNSAVVPPQYQPLSQSMSSAVFNALANVRPSGTYVAVYVANVVLQPFLLALSFIAGADVDAVALQVRAAIVNYVNALPPGAAINPTAFAKGGAAQIDLIQGLNFTGQEVVSPVGSVVPMPLQVLRTSLGLVSAQSAQTDTPLTNSPSPDAYIIAGGQATIS